MNNESIQYYAKMTGVLLLISIIAGAFGEAYIPSIFFIADDPAATASNLQNSELLFRAGFAGYLVEAICDVALSLLLYVLLKPVNKNLALMSAFFGLVSTSVFASSQLFSFAALYFVNDSQFLNTFTQHQLNALMLLSVKYAGLGGGVFMVFYGVATGLRGYLIFRSGFLPEFIGVLLIIAGMCFIVRSFLLVLIPDYASFLFLLPMIIAIITFTFWLLIKGVDINKWQDWSKPGK